MADRFTVRRILPDRLWEVTDHHKQVVEFVLFGDYGVDHARLFLTVESVPDMRSEALRQLATRATRAGIRHSFVPPVPFVPVLAQPGDW